jgi:hypothetical protein
MVKKSLNDLDAQIAALEGEVNSSDDDSISDRSVSETDKSNTDENGSVSSSESFSGYSCDSSSSDYSDSTESEDERSKHEPKSGAKVDYDRKANQTARKKARLGMSSICFKYILGTCKLRDCIFDHIELATLSEEEKGQLTRELHKRPYDPALGAKLKILNIPICKEYTKTGQCKWTTRCRFWHIQTENDAKWSGCDYWCQPCRKAFTSETQLGEHCNGKFHKQRTGHTQVPI